MSAAGTERSRGRGSSTLLILLVAVLAAPSASGAAMVIRAEYVAQVSFETGEARRAVFDSLGQRNCLDAPAVQERPGCAFRSTGQTNPPSGIPVLDAVMMGAGLTDPDGDAKAFAESPTSNYAAFLIDANRGMSAYRAADGNTPDMIVPGRSQLWAWHGLWSDLDLDGDIDVSILGTGPRPKNEWVPDVVTSVVAYLEPGSHPAVTNFERPDELSPDVRLAYNVESYAHAAGGGSSVFLSGASEANVAYSVMLTGSLFEVVRITTVTDAILAPSAGGNPYTPRPHSLVDVDEYVAVAPQSVADTYGTTLGTILGPLGSPSVGYCPNACRPEPVSFEGTILAGPTGDLQGSLFAPYPQEWREGSGSTNAGREGEYRTRYTDWIDFQPRWSLAGGPALARSSPLPGRASDGALSMAPGVLSGDVRLGLWYDSDGDGFVGSALDGNPYHGGSRPIADDYENSRGEYYGAEVFKPGASVTTATFEVYVTPHGTWGDGAARLDNLGQPMCGSRSLSGLDPACLSGAWLLRGSETLPLTFSRDSSTPGLYKAVHSVWMPYGSPGFDVCTQVIEIAHAGSGFEDRAALQDCDTIAPWESRGGLE